MNFKQLPEYPGVYLPVYAEGEGAVGSWFAYILRSGSSGEVLTAEEAWKDVKGAYVFAAAEPEDLTNFLVVLRERLNVSQEARFAWVVAWTAADRALTTNLLNLKGAPGVNATTSERMDFQFPPSTLRVAQDNGVALQPDGLNFDLTPPAEFPNAVYTRDDSRPESKVELQSPLVLSLGRMSAGQLIGALAFNELNLNDMRTSCSFYMPTEDEEYLPIRFSVFQLDDGSDRLFNMVYDPAARLNVDRTYFAFGDNTEVGSYFRTNVGKAVGLKAGANARLVLQSDPEGPIGSRFFYVTPCGDFTVTAQSNDGVGRVMPGGSGAEYLAFNASSGATLRFVADKPAFAAKALRDKCTTDFGALENPALLTNEARTAWIEMGPPPDGAIADANNGANGNANGDAASAQSDYFAQPVSAALFSKSAQFKQEDVLGFLELTSGALTLDGKSFPVTPLGRVDLNNYYSVADLKKLLDRAVAPDRRKTISPTPPSDTNVKEVMATTNQGVVARVDVDAARWRTMQLAQTTDTDGRTITVQINDVTRPLQDALQADNTFVVASKKDSLGVFTGSRPSSGTIPITGWEFDLEPRGADSTIMVMKFYDGVSLEKLIDCVELWSTPTEFNNPEDLPDVHATIKASIDTAIANATDPNWRALAEAATNPRWSGILVFNVPVPPSGLPNEIRGITAGMDLSQFKAAYFGIDVNLIRSGIDGPELQQSSMFALIDYSEPEFTPAVTCYDFHVELLRVLFTNSQIRDFACTVKVAVNTLWDEPMKLQSNEDNLITIEGGYIDADGQSRYSFVTQGAFEFDAVDSKAIVSGMQINQIEFSTVNTEPAEAVNYDDPMTITSRFSIWGAMRFRNTATGEPGTRNADIFSYESLSVSGVGILMQNRINVEPSPALLFAFDPRSTVFNPKAVDTKLRDNSLLKGFPIKLSSLRLGPAPDDYIREMADCKPGKTFKPADDGFFTIDIPADDGPTGLETPNYALFAELDLGTLGALVSFGQGLNAQVLLGWNGSEWNMWISLPSIAGGRMEFDLMGVLQLTFDLIRLEFFPDENDDIVFVLMLGSFKLMMFNKVEISLSTRMDLMLFADPSNTKNGATTNLGWYFGLSNTAAAFLPPPPPESSPTGDSALQDEQESQALAKKEDPENDEDKDDKAWLEVAYLGLGQRVGPPTSDPNEMRSVADVLKYMMEKLPSSNMDRAELMKELQKFYHADRNWLIGAKFTLFEAVTLGGVFNDPVLYGLYVKVVQKDSFLEGFEFQIMYKKITDDIGVYSANVTLPDKLRKLDFKKFTIYLPSIGVQIFTNGNFRIDIGYPTDITNFDNSFGVTFIVFQGKGGLYFGYLNSITSSTLSVPSGATLDPVLEMGIALSLGLGKELKSGPFKANLSLTVNGSIEGAAGWILEGGKSNIMSVPNAWLLQGQLYLVGKISGEADFGIVKAGISLLVAVGIGARWQNDKPFIIWFEAKVEVTAWAKIGFKVFGVKIQIKVSFKFKATFREEWTLDDGKSSSSKQLNSASRMLTADDAVVISWTPSKVFNDAPFELPIWFSPQISVIDGSGKLAAQAVTSLVVQSPANETAPTDGSWRDTPFNRLTASLLTWAIKLHDGVPDGDNILDHLVTLTALTSLTDMLDIPPTLATSVNGSTPLDYETLIEFLKLNFTTVVGLPTADYDGSATTFPVIPQSKVRTENQEGTPIDVDFSDVNIRTTQFEQDLAEYFRLLSISDDILQGDDAQLKRAVANGVSMATIVFQDYFALVVKSAVQLAQQMLTDMEQAAITVSDLLDNMYTGNQFGQVSGMASRFVNHGLRVPNPEGGSFPADRELWPALETQALYVQTGQQFPLNLQPVGEEEPPPYTIFYENTDADWYQVGADVKVEIDAEGRAEIEKLENSTIDPGDVRIELEETNQAADVTFALQTITDWSDAGTQKSMYPFTQNLRQKLISDNPLKLAWMEGSTGQVYQSTSGTPISVTYRFTTSLTIAAQRIPDPTNSGSFLSNVYQLGGTSESDRDILERLLLDNPAIETVNILYAGQGSDSGGQGAVSDELNPADILLVKTNLSTESNPNTAPMAMAKMDVAAYQPDPDFSATLADTGSFLRLIDELSIVNSGGYYLYYRNAAGEALPDYLFEEGNQIELTLLTVLQTAQQPAGQSVKDYVNSIVLDRAAAAPEASEDGTVFYADAVDLTTYHSVISPGDAAFRLERSNPTMQFSLPQNAAPERARRSGLNIFEITDALLAAGFDRDSAEFKQAVDEQTETESDLNNMYSLLEFFLRDSGGFKRSTQGLPVGPTEQEEDDPVAEADWRYRQALAVAPFFKDPVPPAYPSDIIPGPSPYAGVGNTAAMQFNFVDFFGNRLNSSSGELDIPVRYFDQLIPPNQWPGVDSNFLVTLREGTADTGDLTINLQFDRESYTENLDLETVVQTMEQYRTIFHQLADAGTAFSVATTLAPGYSGGPDSESIRGTLCAFVEKIYQFLESLLNGTPDESRIEAGLRLVIDRAARDKQSNDIAEIVVEMTMQRNNNLDAEAVKRMPSVKQVSTQFNALTQLGSGEEQNPSETNNSLEFFATQFERAFPELKAASGVNEIGAANLWSVRLALGSDAGGTVQNTQGINVNIETDPIYYAPAPLSRTLWQGTVGIVQYNEDGTPQRDGQGNIIITPVQFTGLDLDDTAQAFLEAVDIVLAPESSVNARRLNPEAFDRILKAKQKLADSIVIGLTYILDVDASRAEGKNLDAARETLRQALLIQLAQAYSIQAVVQYPVEVTSAYLGDDSPRLYGSVRRVSPVLLEEDGPTRDNSTLSTAKIKLAPDDGITTMPNSRLTFGFETNAAEGRRSLELPLEYALSHLEHNFKSTPDGAREYRSSSWLTFLTTNALADMGEANIPLPLREYPTPPTLAGQNPCSGTYAGGGTPLEQARSWHYLYSYEHQDVAQDSIITEIEYNLAPEAFNAMMKMAVEIPLSDWLARFSREYPVLQPLLNELSGDNPSEAASNALTAFAEIVAGAADSWRSWVEGQSLVNNKRTAARGTDRFEVSHPDDDGAMLVIRTKSATGVWPTILEPRGDSWFQFDESEVPGKPMERRYGPGGTVVERPSCAPGGTQLSFKRRARVQAAGDDDGTLTRLLIMDKLDILTWENAWGGIKLERNRRLSVNPQTGDFYKVNENFVYQTPLVRYVNIASPLTDTDACINLAALDGVDPSWNRLEPYLQNLFNQLFGDGASARMRVGCLYGFTIFRSGQKSDDVCEQDGVVTLLPVFLREPFSLTGMTAKELSTAVCEWFKQNDPAVQDGFFAFDIAVFSELSQSNLPLLRLRNVRIGLDKITDLGSECV